MTGIKAKIAVLPGDGIGPEVVHEAVRVLQTIAHLFRHEFEFTEYLIGGISIDQHGVALTDEILADCQASDAVLLGAVGGPKWDDPSASVRPEQGLLGLRKGLGVYANLRPVRVHPCLVNASSLKPDRLAGVDLLVVRELTGGLYFSQPKGRRIVDGRQYAVDTLEYADFEIRRVVDLAFRLAQGRRKKVTSVDKANVLESSRLWRQVASATGELYPNVALDHMLVDTASMRLVTNPAAFDVLVTENMFGDILTDEASVLAGSMGLLPSASAPDITGKGIANPVGTILSAALMLRYSLHLEEEAASIEKAVDQATTQGRRTVDLGGSLPTRQMTDEIIERLSKE
jgi:3-isopropylmalate dehydrogenase